MDSALTFQARLRLLRVQAGISQRELARRLGVSHSCISRWEQGLVAPRAEAFERLPAVLAVPPGTLKIGEDADQQPVQEPIPADYDSMSAIIEDARRRAARLQSVSPNSIAVFISSVPELKPLSDLATGKDPKATTWETVWPAAPAE